MAINYLKLIKLTIETKILIKFKYKFEPLFPNFIILDWKIKHQVVSRLNFEFFLNQNRVIWKNNTDFLLEKTVLNGISCYRRTVL